MSTSGAATDLRTSTTVDDGRGTEISVDICINRFTGFDIGLKPLQCLAND